MNCDIILLNDCSPSIFTPSIPVIMLHEGMLSILVSVMTPFCFGTIAGEKMNAIISNDIIAIIIFVDGPAEKTLALFILFSFINFSSSGSTNAPTGRIKKSKPKEFILIFATLARIP